MKKLYKFCWDCGRNGNVEGVFVEDDKVVNESIGTHVYFGEILGKHSKVQGTLETGDFTELTDDPHVIEIFEKHVRGVGYNPFDYMNEEEESDDEE